MAISGSSQAAEPLPEHVAFFARGLDAPFFAAARLTHLVRLCATRFEQQCQDEEVRPELMKAADPAVFARVTVLGRDQRKLPTATDWNVFVREYAQAREQFMHEYYEYEKTLLPRMGAVFALCPESQQKTFAGVLETVREVNFGRYWAQSSAEYQRTSARMEGAQASQYADILRQWSPEQCAKAREFAFDYLRLFSSKLRDFLGDEWRQYGLAERVSAGVLCIWYFAMKVEGPEAFSDALDYGPTPRRTPSSRPRAE